jgi:hypothetical protein
VSRLVLRSFSIRGSSRPEFFIAAALVAD